MFSLRSWFGPRPKKSAALKTTQDFQVWAKENAHLINFEPKPGLSPAQTEQYRNLAVLAKYIENTRLSPYEDDEDKAKITKTLRKFHAYIFRGES